MGIQISCLRFSFYLSGKVRCSYSLTFIFFNSKNFSEDDFASALRKKQSASWALKWYEDFVIQQLHYLT